MARVQDSKTALHGQECVCVPGEDARRIGCGARCRACHQAFGAGCPGSCNERWRRAQCAYAQAIRDYDPLDADQSRPGPPDLDPVTGNPWCPDCQALIRRQLGELDYLDALRVMAELGADGFASESGGQRVSGSPEPASPSPSGDDGEDVAAMLAGWEAAYRELRGWPSAIVHGELAHQRTECIAWLAKHITGILSSPAGLDFGTEVMAWHADLTAKTKAGKRTLAKPLRCPSCRHLLMRYTDGDRDVRCYNPECRRIMSLPEYEAEVERLAAQIQAAKMTREAARRELARHP